MKTGCRLFAVSAIVLAASFTAYGQQTVNVSPGDDIGAALDQAGPDGTVIFAPGWYDVEPVDPATRYGIRFVGGHEGITLRGAGTGFDPETATILDGMGWFLNTMFRIEVPDVTIENFTVVNIYDESMESTIDAFNVEFRNCYFVNNHSGADFSGSSGFGDFDDFSEAIRFYHCIWANGGDDGTDIEGTSVALFVNCDFYNFKSDIVDNEDNTITLFRNCIFLAGNGSDDIDAGTGIVEIVNSVMYDERQRTGPENMDFAGAVFVEDSVFADPMYVNVGWHVHYLDLDFRLAPGSPAIDIGRDDDGNVTFAGALGPIE